MSDRKNITKSPAQNNPKPKPLNISSREKTRFFIKGFSKMSSKKPTLISPPNVVYCKALASEIHKAEITRGCF